MSEETLDKIYDELRQMHDDIKLKLHLGGMEVRDEWNELDAQWDTWTHQLSQELEAKAADVEAKIREAGPDDLRKAEIATRLAVSKLKSGFKEFTEKLPKDQ